MKSFLFIKYVILILVLMVAKNSMGQGNKLNLSIDSFFVFSCLFIIMRLHKVS